MNSKNERESQQSLWLFFLFSGQKEYPKQDSLCVYNEKAQAIMKCWKNKDTE